MVEDRADRYKWKATKFNKVVVLMGGRSSEREVSLKTGEAVLSALRVLGYNAVGIDAAGDVWNKLSDEKPDVVFIALHGRYGEDGTIQGLLELMDIPYTGSGVMASALAMDKYLTKRVFSQFDIPVAKDFPAVGYVPDDMYPVIVKPSREGSSIGITVVKNQEELHKAIDEATRYDDRVLVEEFVEGRLLTIPVIGQLRPRSLPIVEVIAESGFYDYESKYTTGKTEYICPAKVDDEAALRLTTAAVDAHMCLGCSGVSRSDFILRPDGSFVCLEINTMPGLTETSLVPKAAKADGMSFEDLVEAILKDASLKLTAMWTQII